MTQDNLPELNRRTFLGAGLAAGAIVVVGTAAADALPAPVVANTISIMLRRREDMLRLPITLHNMKRTNRAIPGGSIPVFSASGASPTYLVAELGPQHLTEEAFFNPAQVHRQADARLAGPSRLAFKEFGPTFATLSGLLLWNAGRASVQNVAEATQGAAINYRKSPPHDPRATETAIEMPWWLVLNPHSESAWRHSITPVTHDGRTEAWHTRLAWQDNSINTPVPREDPDFWNFDIFTVRAVWLRDPNPGALLATTMQPNPARGTTGYPFEMRPTPRDRADLIRLSTLTQGPGETIVAGGRARAISAKMALSPMGGTMSVDGSWEAPSVSNLVKWQQRVWQGRDNFIRIVRSGYLYPWGIKAAVDTQVSRVFLSAANGDIRPFEILKIKVVVREPTVDLTAGGSPYAGRGTPFTTITCTTKETPDLADNVDDRFVPKVQVNANGLKAPVNFDFVATDREGRTFRFSMPMYFAQYSDARHANAQQMINDYAALAAADRTAKMGGASIAFAAPTANTPGSTAFPTIDFVMSLQPPLQAGDVPTGALACYPLMASAHITAENVSRISGSSTPTTVSYPQVYLDHAFAAASNETEVFLKALAAAGVSMGAKSAGGLITPTFNLAGFARGIGPVLGQAGKIEAIAANSTVARVVADPTDAIQEMFGDIKLLGGITLADVLGETLDLNGPAGMRIVTKTSGNVSTTTMSWTKSLEAVEGTLAALVLVTQDATLNLTSQTIIDVSTGTSQNTMTGEITGLGVTLIGSSKFIGINFNRLAFTSGSGRDTDIEVTIGDVEFLGSMSFLQTLSDYLPTKGSGLSIAIDGSGITAGLALTLPNIALGAFTLTGIKVGVKVTIPFGSDPMRFRFNFSEPDDPFGCTVLGIGGAGSYVMRAGLDGVERLEVTAVLQVCVALDFGVASGMVRVMAGITFAIALPAGQDPILELTAFIRIQGRVEVICIIEVGIEVYLGLTAEVPAPGSGEHVKLTGEASVSVKVSVLCFSKTVSWTIRRTIEGPVVPALPDFLQSVAPAPMARGALRAGAAPSAPSTSFGDAMSAQDWSAWCGAFA